MTPILRPREVGAVSNPIRGKTCLEPVHATRVPGKRGRFKLTPWAGRPLPRTDQDPAGDGWKNDPVDHQPVVGWNRDPEIPDRYRYWNGREWTGHATAFDHGSRGIGVAYGGSCGGWHQRWYRTILRNTVVFHTMAWFDCSVPVTRGRLRRFMEPIEQRTLDQIVELRHGG